MKLILEKLKIIGLLLTMLVLDQLVVTVAALMSKQHALATGWAVALFLAQVLATALFLVYAKRKQLLRGKVFWSGRTIKIALLAWLAMRLPMYAGSAIMALEGVKNTANQAALESLMTRLPLALMGLFTVISAPIMEEIMFRHVIPKELFKSHQKIGFAIGVLLFTLLHGPSDLGSFVVYAGMGAVLAYVYYKTECLEYSIVTHALNNGLSFLMMMLLPLLT